MSSIFDVIEIDEGPVGDTNSIFDMTSNESAKGSGNSIFDMGGSPSLSDFEDDQPLFPSTKRGWFNLLSQYELVKGLPQFGTQTLRVPAKLQASEAILAERSPADAHFVSAMASLLGDPRAALNLIPEAREAKLKDARETLKHYDSFDEKYFRAVGKSRAAEWSNAIGGGIGSAAASILGATFTGGAMVPMLLFGTLAGTGALLESAEAGEGAIKSYGLAGTRGALEAWIEQWSLGVFTRASGKPLWRTAIRAATEGIEEVSQEFSGNLIAKFGYDESRELTANLLEAGILGVISGAPMSSIMTFAETKGVVTKLRALGLSEKLARKQAATILHKIENGVTDIINEELEGLPPEVLRAFEGVKLLGSLGETPVGADLTESMVKDIREGAKFLDKEALGQRKAALRQKEASIRGEQYQERTVKQVQGQVNQQKAEYVSLLEGISDDLMNIEVALRKGTELTDTSIAKLLSVKTSQPAKLQKLVAAARAALANNANKTAVAMTRQAMNIILQDAEKFGVKTDKRAMKFIQKLQNSKLRFAGQASMLKEIDTEVADIDTNLASTKTVDQLTDEIFNKFASAYPDALVNKGPGLRNIIKNSIVDNILANRVGKKNKKAASELRKRAKESVSDQLVFELTGKKGLPGINPEQRIIELLEKDADAALEELGKLGQNSSFAKKLKNLPVVGTAATTLINIAGDTISLPLNSDTVISAYLSPLFQRIFVTDKLVRQQVKAALELDNAMKMESLIRDTSPKFRRDAEITLQNGKTVPLMVAHYLWQIRGDKAHRSNAFKQGVKFGDVVYDLSATNETDTYAYLESVLPANEKKFVDGLATMNRNNYEAVSKQYMKLRGKKLEQIPGWVHESREGDPIPEAATFVDEPLGTPRTRKMAKDTSQTKGRVKGATGPLNADYVANYAKTANRAIEYVAFADLANLQSKIMGDPNIKEKLSSVFGERMYKFISKDAPNSMISHMANDGALVKMASVLMQNLASSTLIGNVSTYVLQMTSTPYAVVELGVEAAPKLFKNQIKFLVGGKNALHGGFKFMTEKSPFMAERYKQGRFEVGIEDALLAATPEDILQRKTKKRWLPLKFFDAVASVPQWRTGYEIGLEEGKAMGMNEADAEKHAIRKGDMLIKRVNNWSAREDRSLVQTDGFGNAMTQFLNMPMQIYRGFFKNTVLAKRGKMSYGDMMSRMIVAIMMMGVAVGSVRRGFKLPKDKETVFNDIMKQVFGGVPLLNIMIGGSDGVAAFSGFQTLRRAYGELMGGNPIPFMYFTAMGAMTIAGVPGLKPGERALVGASDIIQEKTDDYRRLAFSKSALDAKPWWERYN